jgi:hypothetical protein
LPAVPVADARLTVAIVAAVAAILSAGGAFTAAVVAWQLGIRRFKHERSQADREDARDVLAAGALALGRAKATRRKVHTNFRRPLGDLSERWPNDFVPELEYLLTAYEDLEAAVAPLRVRFDVSDAVVAEASCAVEDVNSLYQLYWRSHGRAFNQNRNRDASQDAVLARALIASYDAHENAYLAAAQQAVGAKL